ncbi:MAG: response regulator [Desulfobacterales bacterium]|nr:response regulator [Desulfobacterales bacterium]
MDINKKVLIADDFTEVTRFIRYSLKNIGFTNIREADSGKAALRALKKEKYDLIFCDWNMPDMSGMEVLNKIRSDDELKDIPFIMVTASAEEEKILAAIKAGVSNYILKPFTAETINETLYKVFGD